MAIKLLHNSRFEIAKEESGKVVLEPAAGSSISRAALEAVSIAKANPRVSVSFVFNGTEVSVKPNDNGAGVEKRWQDQSNRKYKEWAASPEGKAELARSE